MANERLIGKGTVMRTTASAILAIAGGYLMIDSQRDTEAEKQRIINQRATIAREVDQQIPPVAPDVALSANQHIQEIETTIDNIIRHDNSEQIQTNINELLAQNLQRLTTERIVSDEYTANLNEKNRRESEIKLTTWQTRLKNTGEMLGFIPGMFGIFAGIGYPLANYLDRRKAKRKPQQESNTQKV